MRDGERRRVVVTGLGMITPLGGSVAKTWEGIRAGRSGIGPITRFDTTGLETTIGGEVRDFDPLEYMERKEARRADRFAQFAVATASQAIAAWSKEWTAQRAELWRMAAATAVSIPAPLISTYTVAWGGAASSTCARRGTPAPGATSTI